MAAKVSAMVARGLAPILLAGISYAFAGERLTPIQAGGVGLVLAVFVVGQFLEGNFITPKLVGERVGLHPVWVILSVMAGGALFGFLGVLLAVPVAAAIGVLSRYALERYLASPLYRGTGRPPPADAS